MTKQEIISKIILEAQQEIRECTNKSVTLYCKSKGR